MSQITTSAEIITKFELFAGDETELSSDEELDLLQKIYNEVCNQHEWERLKKTASGTLSTTVPYIAEPADFSNLTEKAVIYVFTSSTSFDTYYVVPFEERRQYLNQKQYAYYDARVARFIFMVQPAQALAYEFDYIFVPAVLTIAGSDPIFPTRFYDLFYHGMLVDNDIIQMSDKARSYQAVNQARYTKILSDMKAWNDKTNAMTDYGV